MSSDILPDYMFCTELVVSKSPVNTLLFSTDGNLLVSGGDDETLRVWDMTTFKSEIVLHNPKSHWGQITVLTWVYIDTPIDNKSKMLAVGAGRGNVTLCPMNKVRPIFAFKEAKTMPVFDFNDAVEAMSYDRTNSRLAVTSHSGAVKVYAVDKVSLNHVWTVTVGNAIPRAVFFHGASNSLLMTLSLETGEVCCREVETSQVLWKKTLEGAIGNAALSADQSTLIVDNLSNGSFDVYLVPSNSQTTSLAFSETLRYPKQCIFSEGAMIAVCGSITNKVYIVDVTSSEIIQTLTAGNEKEMFQTVAAMPGNRTGALIAGGSSKGTIYLWKRMELEKKDIFSVVEPDTPVQPQPLPAAAADFNNLQLQVMALVVCLTYGSWSPFLWKLSATVYAGFQIAVQYLYANE